MKAPTMLETIRSLLGKPACAIPLSCCKPAKEYLLERAGISRSGTVVIFAIPYVMTDDATNSERNVSLYAVPRDYHRYIQMLSQTLIPSLVEFFPTHKFVLYADHSPICEVNAAARAGLGVLGMNGLLITPTYGSFVFLGELVTSADYETVTGEAIPIFPDQPLRCENCGTCMVACPGGCRNGDREHCLSALTQKKGALTDAEIAAIKENGLVWGCDTCQHNRRVIQNRIDTPIPYFREERLLHIDTGILDAMSDEAFLLRAYAWRGRSVIQRNTALFDTSDERSSP